MGQKLDAIIFGATGFTGKVVVEDAVELLKDFKWGIAGRNEARLNKVLKDVGTKLGKDLSHIPIILTDVKDNKSIVQMASRCKIVINCCGPYQFYGEPVVKACIDEGTHHVDVTGEQLFIDTILLKYDELAKEKGVYVVSACGFDCIPAEVGVVYAERQFEGTVNSIEMFLENSVTYKDERDKALLHHGTWDSAIYAVKYFRKWFTLKALLKKVELPELKPKLRMKFYVQKPSFLTSYFLPYTVPDRDMVKRSQSVLYEIDKKRPVQFESYIGFRSLFTALWLPIYIILLVLLGLFSCTRKYLLQYPNIFSLGVVSVKGPTQATMESQSVTLTFRANGWSQGRSTERNPDKEMLTRVHGRNPFYGLTSVAIICCAKTILSESEKMPGRGGVLPPGAAFAKTSLLEQLTKHKNGLQFETLK